MLLNSVKLLVASIMISSILHAQIPKEPANIQSPNAMSFGMFGDIPVSYYSGVPSIQVPLYTVSENKLNVPITLNYHAAGFRPDVHPGWVGANWNLSIGGVITRTVRDYRDDNYADGMSVYGRGYYYNHDINTGADWETLENLTLLVTNSYNSQPDTEPDEFSFNFPGYSGKFYLDHNGNWKVSCDRPVKVEVNEDMIPTFLVDNDDGYMHFSGFTITDEFGNKYVFGVDPLAVEYSAPFFADGGKDWTAQAWYLTRIVHADGYEVQLKYERDDYVNQMYSAYNVTTNYYQDGGSGILNINCSDLLSGNNGLMGSYSGKLVSPVYLSSIETTNETILFKRSNTTELRYSQVNNDYHNPYQYKYDRLPQSPTPPLANYIQQNPVVTYVVADFYTSLNKLQFKQLDTIQVFNKKGEKLRSFKLYYTANTAKRLALDSLREIGKFEEQKPCYRFTYKPYGSTEPLYLDNKNDHYGYYNGNFANTDDFSSYFSYRDYYDPAVTQYGIIDQITYPTGGVSKFYFESHKYNKRVQEAATRGIDNSYNALTIAGGLRIKKIESYDLSTSSVKKTQEYFYLRNYISTSNPALDASSGVLGARSKYYYLNRRLPTLDAGGIYYEFTFGAQSVLPASENSAGTHVGYSEVTEKLNDGSYSKFFFNNYDNGHLDDSALVVQERTPYELVSSRSIERGTLQKQEDYSSTNTLLKKKVIEYTDLNRANEFARAVDGGIFRVCKSGSAVQAYRGTAYRLYTYSYLPKQEFVTDYAQGGTDSLVTKKYFFYNNNTRLLVKDSTIISTGDPICNYYYYPADVINYIPLANVPIAQTIGYMTQKNMIGHVMQTITSRKVAGIEYLAGINLTTYKTFGSLVKPSRQYDFTQPAIATTKAAGHLYKVGFSSGAENETFPLNTELAMNFTKYDIRGNITTLSKEQDVNVSYLWRNNFKLPVAKVVNAYNNHEYGLTTVTKELIIKKPDPKYNTATSFIHQAAGNIQFTYKWTGTPPVSGYTGLSIRIQGPQDIGIQIHGDETETLVNYPAGTYMVFIQCDDDDAIVAYPANLIIKYNAQNIYQTTTNTSAEFFYEGFEDAIASGIKPFAGSNCTQDDYVVPYTVPAGGVYLIDYYYLDAGVWKYRKKSYVNNMTITEGSAIDEVRVYRRDSQISTYTYDTDFGITSQSDVNGKTENYFYDGLGRLIVVKDDQTNILKRICYTYYGQTQNCSIDTSSLWQFTGDTRCKPCSYNSAYHSTVVQELKRNVNPHSATFNDIMWIDNGTSTTCLMTIPTNWIQTATALRCQKNEVTNNTGYREKEEIDTFKCSYTYNNLRWTVYDYNTSVCPINQATVKFTSVGGISGGYVTFTGTAGTFTFNFPNGYVTNQLLGTVPGGIYTVYITTGGSTRTVSWNGNYAFAGSSNTISGLMVGGPNNLIRFDY